jgi:hypothetical protein
MSTNGPSGLQAIFVQDVLSVSRCLVIPAIGQLAWRGYNSTWRHGTRRYLLDIGAAAPGIAWWPPPVLEVVDRLATRRSRF